MNKDQLIQVIEDQQQNRLSAAETVTREKYSDIGPLKKHKNIVIITGIRRCGKSTFLAEVRRKEKHSDYYLNFDDDRLIEFKVPDFQKLYEVFIELYGEQDTFFFDEIQNIEGWERFVRRLHDSNKKVYITGSNASMLSRELGTHLTGRYSQLELYPFSFREYLTCHNIDTGISGINTTPRKSVLKRFFMKYIKDGGFPEYVKTKQADYLKMLYEGILYKDILARYNLSNEKQIKELVYYVASNIGKEISFNSLKTMLGLGSSTTVKEYFSYFENSYLTFLLQKYDVSAKKQVYSNKKVYFIDTAAAEHLGFRFSSDKGRLLENIVFIELKRTGQDVFFHKNAKECDFIIKQGNKIHAALQVCTSLENKETRDRELTGLLEALNYYSLPTGYILTEDEDEVINTNGKKVQVTPIWKWLVNNQWLRY
ncbi:MAG: ATP-binding protein [Elusimicrobiota bacterium]